MFVGFIIKFVITKMVIILRPPIKHIVRYFIYYKSNIINCTMRFNPITVSYINKRKIVVAL